MPKFGTALFGRFKFGTYVRPGSSLPGAPKMADGSFSSRGYYLLHGGAAKVLEPGGTILTNFGTFIRGIDVASRALKDAVASALTSYNLKVYLQDASSSPKWVDITDHVQWRGRNQVISIGSIEYSCERPIGALQQKMSNLVVSNVDGFWNRPWVESNTNNTTDKIKATYDSNWNFLSESNATTTWYLSQNGQQTALYHHKIAVRAEFAIKGGTVEAATLGVFLLVKKECNGEAETASLTLAPLSSVLTEGNEAEAVKEGAGWYRNRTPKFLIEELLKEKFADSSYALPDDWNIEDIIDYDVPLSGRDRWVASHFGRPPERTIDATVDPDGVAEWEADQIKIATAISIWEYGNNSDTLGTISVTPGSTTISGTSTEWENADQPPRVGDAFIIPKEFTDDDGGSALENDGRYYITAIGGDTDITIDRPVQGTAAESELTYSIVRLYIGVQDTLYEYNVSTDTYFKLGSIDDTNMYIAHIWHNTADATYPIWGVALSYMTEQDDAVTENMRFFRFRWDSGIVDFDIWGTGTPLTCFSGQWTIRESDYLGPGGGYKVGHFDGLCEHTPITILFPQYLVTARSVASVLLKVYEGTDLTTDVSDSDTPKFNLVKRAFISPVSHYHISNANNAINPRYSMGQTGFLVFQPNYGTNGAIAFCRTSLPTIDSNADPNNAPDPTYSYYFLDLSQSDPDDSDNIPNETQITAGNFTISGTDYDSGYMPTSACADPDNESVYIAVSKFTQNNLSTDPLETSVLAITDFDNSTVSENQKLWGAGVDPCDSFIQEMVATSLNIFVNVIALEDVYNYYILKDNYFPHIILGWNIATGIGTTIHDSKSMYQGLCKVDIGAESPTQKIFVQIPTEGRILYLDDTITDQSDDGGSPATTVSSDPAIELDSYLYRGQIASSQNIKELYWISAPVPNFTLGDRIEGRFYLCKWSPTYPARIDLADFSGQSIWEALSNVTEVVDARFGFRPDGTFFFKRKPKHETSIYTFSNVEESRVLSFSMNDGTDDIVNEAIRIPSIVKLADSEVSLQLTTNSKAENYSLEVVQLTEKSTSIKLQCIEGGIISRAIWAYTIWYGISNTNLRLQYTANSYSLILDDIGDIVYGSLITVSGVDSSNIEITDTTRAGHVLEYNGIDLVLNESVQIDEDILTFDSGSYPALNSTAADDISHIVSSGDIIIVANIGSELNYEYMYVIAVNSATIQVSRGANSISKPVIHNANEKIILLRNGHTIFTFSALATRNRSIGDKVSLEHPDESVWSKRFFHDPADTSSTTPSSYNTWTGLNGAFITIGGANAPHCTGIKLKLTWIDPNDGSSASDNEFSIGDIIRITCPGLVLEEDPASLRIFSDMGSQATWKKKTDDAKSPYLNSTTAKFSVYNKIQNEANPHYRFTAETILTPWLQQLDVVDIQDPTLLPRASEKKVAAYITNINFDLQNRGLQTLQLRSTKAY